MRPHCRSTPLTAVRRRCVAVWWVLWIGWMACLGNRDALAADPVIRHFRAGVLIGANIDAEFSQTGDFATSGGQAGVFDDGFVLTDDTGNAQGLTSYWGYNDESQYDGGNLTFTSTSGFNVTDSSTANSDPQFGLDLAYGGTLKRIGKTWLSWEVGFSLVPINVKGQSSSDATLSQTSSIFKTGSVVIPLAPYQGSPSGGPLISAVGMPGSSNTISGTMSASRKIEAMLYNLRVGPHFHWDLSRKWSMEAMGGFALGFVDGEYSYDERLLTGTGQSSTSGNVLNNTWLYGGYVGVLTQVHVERNAYFYGSAQFMTLGNADFSGDGREAELRLDQGLYFSLGFTWLF